MLSAFRDASALLSAAKVRDPSGRLVLSESQYRALLDSRSEHWKHVVAEHSHRGFRS